MTKKRPIRTDSGEQAEIPTINEETSLGEIKINHTVVASIVRLAALEVHGTHSVACSGFEGVFKRKDAVIVAEDEAENYLIEVHVVMRFGVELAKVALAIQENIKSQVTRMTMKDVARVDVIIERVEMEDPADTEESSFETNND